MTESDDKWGGLALKKMGASEPELAGLDIVGAQFHGGRDSPTPADGNKIK